LMYVSENEEPRRKSPILSCSLFSASD
jgi:hypothetical protein